MALSTADCFTNALNPVRAPSFFLSLDFFLLQTGTKYDEAKDPYLVILYDRDRECQVFSYAADDVVKDNKLPEDYKTLDFVTFAQNNTFADFIWACGLFLLEIAKEENKTIFSASALADYCGRDLQDHWYKFHGKGCTRSVPQPKELIQRLNRLLEPLRINTGIKAVLYEEDVAEISQTERGVGINYEIRSPGRIKQLKGKNWLHELKKGQGQTVHWASGLAMHQAVTWIGLDPFAPTFDTRRIKILKAKYDKPKDQAAFEDQVLMWQFMLNSGQVKNQKGDDFTLDPEAAPEFKTLRYRYAMFSGNGNRLCWMPPLSTVLSEEHDAQCNSRLLPETSVCNIQYPAFYALYQQARHGERKTTNLRVPSSSSSSPTEALIVKELETPIESLPLPWRLALDKDTQMSQIAEMEELRPAAYARNKEHKGCDPSKVPKQPLAQVISKSRLEVAAAISPNADPATFQVKDIMSASLNMYRLYLQGCYKYKTEAAVIGHVLRSTKGNGNDIPELEPLELIEILFKLQWGERLWFAMLHRHIASGLGQHKMVDDGDTRSFLPDCSDLRKSLLGNMRLFVGADLLDEFIDRHFIYNKNKNGGDNMVPLLRRLSFWRELLKFLKIQFFDAKTGAVISNQREATGYFVDELVKDTIGKKQEEEEEDKKEAEGILVCIRNDIPGLHTTIALPRLIHLADSKQVHRFLDTADALSTIRKIAQVLVVMPFLCYACSTIRTPVAQISFEGKAYDWISLETALATAKAKADKYDMAQLGVKLHGMANKSTRLVFGNKKKMQYAASKEKKRDWKAEIDSCRSSSNGVTTGSFGLLVETLLTNNFVKDVDKREEMRAAWHQRVIYEIIEHRIKTGVVANGVLGGGKHVPATLVFECYNVLQFATGGNNDRAPAMLSDMLHAQVDAKTVRNTFAEWKKMPASGNNSALALLVTLEADHEQRFKVCFFLSFCFSNGYCSFRMRRRRRTTTTSCLQF